MSMVEPFRKAYQSLGLEPGSDLKTVKRAYRRKVSLHPPDRDPEGFRSVREAFELISNPYSRVDTLLYSEVPLVPPPELPEDEEKRADPVQFHRLLLKRAVQELDVEDLIGHDG